MPIYRFRLSRIQIESTPVEFSVFPRGIFRSCAIISMQTLTRYSCLRTFSMQTIVTADKVGPHMFWYIFQANIQLANSTCARFQYRPLYSGQGLVPTCVWFISGRKQVQNRYLGESTDGRIFFPCKLPTHQPCPVVFQTNMQLANFTPRICLHVPQLFYLGYFA